MDPHSSHEDIGKKRQQYAADLKESGFSPEGRTIPVARLLAIAPTDAEAKEVARAGAQWTVGSYAKGMRNAAGKDPVERYVDDVVVHGTPERVAEQLLELQQTIGLDYLLCAPLSQESFVLFNEEVLPKLT